MTTANITSATDADGIATITWDMPGRSMNVIDMKVMDELSAIIEQVAKDLGLEESSFEPRGYPAMASEAKLSV